MKVLVSVFTFDAMKIHSLNFGFRFPLSFGPHGTGPIPQLSMDRLEACSRGIFKLLLTSSLVHKTSLLSSRSPLIVCLASRIKYALNAHQFLSDTYATDILRGLYSSLCTAFLLLCITIIFVLTSVLVHFYLVSAVSSAPPSAT